MNYPTIYIGWDPREQAAYDVAAHSLRRRSSTRLNIHCLTLNSVRKILTRDIEYREGRMWDPISQAPMSTQFAISRFCVPFIQTGGWALFADCDILSISDINELFELADDRHAVMCVKHQQESGPETKMDGQAQTYYSRKNWSSVVLWNCSHPLNQPPHFTAEMLNTWPGRDLHAFKWLPDEAIGALPREWNHLVGVSPQTQNHKILHYTLGGPWLRDWIEGPMDGLWIAEHLRIHPIAGQPVRRAAI